MMPTQGVFDGFAPAAPVQSLFFALLPDAPARGSIARLTDALRSEHDLHGHRIDPARYHLTLHYLGESAGPRQDVEMRAAAAAKTVRSEAFDVTLDNAVSFRGRDDKPCVLRSSERAAPLHALWRELGTALAKVGLSRHLDREFAPHVTIGYDPKSILAVSIAPLTWAAVEFLLIRSVRGQARHEVLGRFPLGIDGGRLRQHPDGECNDFALR